MEPPLAAYKDSLGEPRKGFHAARIPILDVALWDTLGTIVIAALVAYAFKWSAWKTILGAFVLATFLHWLFGVRTKMTTTLGLLSAAEDEST